MQKVVILDAGEYTDRRGLYSGARLYSVLRSAESEGDLRIDSIVYIESLQSQSLPFEEPDKLRDRRGLRMRAVQRKRVENTSQFLLGKPSSPGCATADADLIVIILKPDDDKKGRNARICDALTSAPKANVIVFPPYFSNLEELKELKACISPKDIDRLYMWLPYRFSPGVLAAGQAKEEAPDEIAAITLHVMAGPYPRKAFVHDFIMPYFDLLPVLGGGLIKKLRVIESSPMGLPVFGFQAVHAPAPISSGNAPAPISSGIFTAAGGSFQNISHAKISLYSTNLWSLNMSGAFLHEVLQQTPESHITRGTVSHDASPNFLNGSHGLLHRIIGDDWVGDEKTRPTLPNCFHIQDLIDSFLSDDPPETNSVRFGAAHAPTDS